MRSKLKYLVIPAVCTILLGISLWKRRSGSGSGSRPQPSATLTAPSASGSSGRANEPESVPPRPDYGDPGPRPTCFDACVDCLERCRESRGKACYYEQFACFEVKMMCCRLMGAGPGRGSDPGAVRAYGTSRCGCGERDEPQKKKAGKP